jgi:hypothetical protein
MKSIVLAVLISLCSSTAFAEQPANPTAPQATDKARDQIHRGNVKIAVGVGLAVAGLLAGPLSTGTDKEAQHDGIGGGMAAVGMGLIVWGVKQRLDALKPQTTLGFTLGSRTGIQIGRRW